MVLAKALDSVHCSLIQCFEKLINKENADAEAMIRSPQRESSDSEDEEKNTAYDHEVSRLFAF